MKLVREFVFWSTFWNRRLPFVYPLLSFAVLAVLTFNLFNSDIEWSPPSQSEVALNSIQCPSSGSKLGEAQSLQIYTYSHNLANMLVGSLCEQFGHASFRPSISWGLSKSDLEQKLIDGEFDVVYGTEQVVEQFSIKSMRPYSVVAEYDSYSAYLVSKHDWVFSRKGLAGKRVGLLSNRGSRSGYLLPYGALTALGLSEHDYKIVYAPGHPELRALLNDGDVDVIGSYWSDQDRKTYPSFIAKKASNEEIGGTKWYIESRLFNSVAHCILAGVLQENADSNSREYFQNIRFRESSCG